MPLIVRVEVNRPIHVDDGANIRAQALKVGLVGGVWRKDVVSGEIVHVGGVEKVDFEEVSESADVDFGALMLENGLEASRYLCERRDKLKRATEELMWLTLIIFLCFSPETPLCMSITIVAGLSGMLRTVS